MCLVHEEASADSILNQTDAEIHEDQSEKTTQRLPLRLCPLERHRLQADQMIRKNSPNVGRRDLRRLWQVAQIDQLPHPKV